MRLMATNTAPNNGIMTTKPFHTCPRRSKTWSFPHKYKLRYPKPANETGNYKPGKNGIAIQSGPPKFRVFLRPDWATHIWAKPINTSKVSDLHDECPLGKLLNPSCKLSTLEHTLIVNKLSGAADVFDGWHRANISGLGSPIVICLITF
jgi:hypothetical protein